MKTARRTQMNLRLSDDERTAISRAAAQSHEPVSIWCRRILLVAAEYQPEEDKE